MIHYYDIQTKKNRLERPVICLAIDVLKYKLHCPLISFQSPESQKSVQDYVSNKRNRTEKKNLKIMVF